MKDKTANSSSPLESLWLEFERLAIVVARRARDSDEHLHERAFWLGYKQAMKDMRSILNVHVVNELLAKAEKRQEVKDELAALRRDADLSQVQELPHKKAG